MMRTKFMFSILLATILLATQVFAVGAMRVTQDTPPITGTVDSITLETDTQTGETTVVIVLATDETGTTTQTVRVSLEYATDVLHLIGADGQPVPLDTLVGPIEIDPNEVLQEPAEDTQDEAQHPVGSALSDFFSDLLGVDYDTIMDYHEDGVGFGVIAQALWMTNALNNSGETEMSQEELSALFAAILDAKQNHDYGDITLPDGSTPENWGQFRKAVLQDREKAKENLGAIMSGHANNGQGEEIQTQEEVQTQNEVHGNGNAPDKNKDKSNNGNGPDKEKNNNGKDKGKGNPH